MHSYKMEVLEEVGCFDSNIKNISIDSKEPLKELKETNFPEYISIYTEVSLNPNTKRS